jgi:hypothetical protein
MAQESMAVSVLLEVFMKFLIAPNAKGQEGQPVLIVRAKESRSAILVEAKSKFLQVEHVSNVMEQGRNNFSYNYTKFYFTTRHST